MAAKRNAAAGGGATAKHLILTIAQGGGRRDRFNDKKGKGGLLLPWVPVWGVVISQVFDYGLLYVCWGHIWVIVGIEAVHQGVTV